MIKVVGMLVSLAMFAAMPAVAFAQGGDGNDNISSGNEQNAELNQEAIGGDAGNGGIGGDAGNQGAIIQQNAGRDANAEVNQSQEFEGDQVGVGGGGGGGGGVGGGDFDDDNVGGQGGGFGGGGVESVTLARTGFDAWVLALIGGGLLAGGIGLLAAQRRGRLSA